MSNFFLQKNFAKPGETVNIQGTCAVYPSTFASSDDKIAVVENGTGSVISVVGVGEVQIKETSILPACSNGGTGILLTATEDGNPFFMSKDDYQSFTNYEGIFVFFLLLTAFLIRFAKKS